MKKEILRAYKFRIYPDAEQKDNLARTFGSSRYVFNWALDLKDQSYKEGVKLNAGQISAALTQLKKTEEFSWLNEVSSVCLQQSLMNLDVAYKNFFKCQAKHPNFKKRTNKQSARYVSSAFTFKDGKLKLAKHKKHLKMKVTRIITGEVSSVTVSKTPDNKYYASLLVKEQYKPKSKTAKQLGIDLGIKDFATFSDGTKVANPKHLLKSLKKMKRLQRQLSRKVKGSNNRDKARIKVARLHSRIANQRFDFLHKLSTQIVNENQVICVEDLAVKEMLQQNKLIAKLASNLGWRNFLTMLEYKSGWNERQFIKVDRWFASSKTCSACGSINKELKLSQRSWVCSCGAKHDRDHNAAKNILREGLKDIH
jgi:putative transposase